MSKFRFSKGVSYIVVVLFAAALFIVGCQELETPVQSTDSEEITIPIGDRPQYVEGEIIVKFLDGVTTQQFASDLKGRLGKTVSITSVEQIGSLENLALLKSSMGVYEAISAVKGMPGVEYAEPNYLYYHDAVSNDTYYTNGSLWGMYGNATSPANQYGSQAGEAWARGNIGSNTVYVGIIDEGVMKNHTDLTANIWVNPYDPADGRDNDGNGYIDDINGWDFAGNNNTIYDDYRDDHGTHVAGTIGAKGGNGTGVAGVCWDVKIISGKFLSTTGGTTTNAIKAIDYFVDLKKRHGLNIVALNNSWGGGGYSQALYDAIERSNVAGIVFVAAAGNGGTDLRGDNNDLYPTYPASYTNSNIIAVANITSTGGLASSSNYGLTSVDLGAPGSSVYSTVPTRTNGSSYASYTGTSMATPHVTGAIALYAATHPGASASTIKSAILSTTVSTSSLSGKCVTGGRLNAESY